MTNADYGSIGRSKPESGPNRIKMEFGYSGYQCRPAQKSIDIAERNTRM